MTAANILLISHGHRVKDANDRFIHLTDVAIEDFSHVTTPGAFLADVFPIREFSQHAVAIYLLSRFADASITRARMVPRSRMETQSPAIQEEFGCCCYGAI